MRAKNWHTCYKCKGPIGPGDTITRTTLSGPRIPIGGEPYAHLNCIHVKKAIARRKEEVAEQLAREIANGKDGRED